MAPFKIQITAWIGIFLLALSALTPAGAGQFGVSPIRIDLDRGSRSGAITVSNDEEAEPLRVQLRLFEWTQDAAGKDNYQLNEDLLYFPRLMNLEKGEQKLVRVGLRTPALEREKAYRLFIEELPAPPTPGGAQVAISVRFGVPIFVKPAQAEVRGDIDKLALEKGVLRVGVRNNGSTHFTIKSITATSGEAFSKELPGWYLLAGAVREHSVELPAQVCAKLKQIEVTVKAEPALELKGTLSVNASMCGA
jgi:fimbrial chaperone protein